MFSGIIQEKAHILAVQKLRNINRVSFALPRGWKLKVDQSVSIDGICSTVVSHKAKSFEVEYMPETLRLTTAKYFKEGYVVNLERSLRYGDFVDGHFVQGHVEGEGEVVNIFRSGDTAEIVITVPKSLRRYIASKGSIAINGVSLTVARIAGAEVTVALIPYTLAMTTMGSLKKGDRLNIETDMLARYLDSLSRK